MFLHTSSSGLLWMGYSAPVMRRLSGEIVQLRCQQLDLCDRLCGRARGGM